MSFTIYSNFRDSNTDPIFEFLREKFGGKPITFFYDYFSNDISELTVNPYNILFIHEPNEFFGFHDIAITNQSNYSAILSWGENITNNCPNSVLFTYSDNSVGIEFSDSLQNKNPNFEVSFLCGTKQMVEGHKLRHKVLSLEDTIKIPKKWFHVLEDYDWENNCRPGYPQYSKDLSHISKLKVSPEGYGRRVLFQESMFNVVIENVNHKNWYNKIGDNFLTKTVPLYWGCPNIAEFGYDERGIIRFSNEEELLNIINNLTPEVYHEMEPYINHNYNLARQDSIYNNLNSFFTQLIEQNNI